MYMSRYIAIIGFPKIANSLWYVELIETLCFTQSIYFIDVNHAIRDEDKQRKKLDDLCLLVFLFFLS